MRFAHIAVRLAGYRPVRSVLAVLGLALFGSAAVAHPGYLTSARAVIGTEGTCRVAVTCDVLALALNDLSDRVPDRAMLELLDGPRAELDRQLQDASRRFLRHSRVLADGRELPLEADRFPAAADLLKPGAPHRLQRLPVLATAEFSCVLPPGTRQVAFEFPDVIGAVVLTVERPGEEAYAESVPPGTRSLELPLALDATRSATGRPWRARLAGYGSYVRLGFVHIFPLGLDHVLFVLGLFLLGGRLSGLLWQVTAFTVAHSATLALALYGVFKAPDAVVEPLIAASIVLVAIDNLRGGELRWWRVAVVFAFGLVHGMGFAGALQELGLPRAEFVPALVGFNAGVELGQLAVIALAFLAVGWARAWPRYRRWVVVPASLAIGAVALFWTVERVIA
ncbi:HupE/UreJ family protein [Opitutus sp. ER46]|uniref:HupE/UreJ family protein n=1 Tax=Opitutus sp. ER46 TaxID=2161864 RepID=UPI001E2DE0C2|nr:HupE/UreJ family protein [Opitutus sp. ER46]